MSDKNNENWAVEEFSDVDLGDKRRSDRLLKIVGRFAANPKASLPHFLETEAELEGAYRLLSNPAIEAEDILHPHITRSAERARECDVALVLHDTTDIRFSCYGDVLRENLSRPTAHTQGFRLHSSLAITGDGTRFPLGVLSSRAFVHKGDVMNEEAKKWWAERDGILENEQERWLQGILEAEENAPDASLVHVCDREGDAYELLGSLVEVGLRFIIRLGQRRIVFDQDGERAEISEALDKQEFIQGVTRTLKVQARYGLDALPKRVDPSHAPKSRTAEVSFRAMKATIKRPDNRPDLSYIEAPTTVHIVEVLERKPPKGQQPLRWLIATTEPISTTEEILQIVDYYCQRWVIEEFHKALKSGCAYEKRQLSSAHALLNTLSITIPVAVHMLMLRHFMHVADSASALQLFSKEDLLVMRSLSSETAIPKAPTIHQALLVLARIGGHIKANGPPGWQVLYRGYIEFIHAKKGFLAAFKLINMPLPEL